jgi:hypothetical protein
VLASTRALPAPAALRLAHIDRIDPGPRFMIRAGIHLPDWLEVPGGAGYPAGRDAGGRPFVVLAGMAVFGLVSPWLAVSGITAFQRRTPAAMMGRVFGVLRLALTIPQTASIAIGAALITVVDYRVLLVVIAVAAAASSLLIIGQPQIWRRPAPGTARPHADASDSVAAHADAADARNRQEHLDTSAMTRG